MRVGGRFSSGRFVDGRFAAGRPDIWAGYAVNGVAPDVIADFSGWRFKGAAAEPIGFADLCGFSRGSPASYTDAVGILRQAAAGEARRDHIWQGSEWTPAGLLIESEARTNHLVHSSAFEQSVWIKGRASVTADDAVAPDGTATVARLTSTTTSYDGSVRQECSYSEGDVLSFSVYAKAGDRPFLYLREWSRGNPRDSFFDLTGGAPGTVNPAHQARMSYAGNGWYRCSVTVTATRTATSAFEIYNSQDDGNTASSEAGFTHIWGAQLEVGALPSSYIPTGAAPVVRAGDDLGILAGQLPFATMPSALSLALRGDAAMGSTVIPLRWGVADGDRIEQAVSGGQFTLTQRIGGLSEQVASATGLYPSSGMSPFAIASRHGAVLNAACQGVTLAGQIGATLPDLTAMPLSLGPSLMGHISDFRLWSADIGDAGLATASL